ncbi:MAG: formyl transferase [Flavobacteriaceae bacterium]
MDKKIVMLVGHGPSARYVYNGLKTTFEIPHVIRAGAAPGGRRKFIKRRIKRLGYWKVFGQILFKICIVRPLTRLSKKRVDKLKTELHLSDEIYPPEVLLDVPYVNAKESLEVLQKINPDIIIVNGTDIISKKILNGVDATFVNTHVGITPKYRGVHGGYWALACNDKENCGVTVHLVDAGIDTGGILYQGIITPTKKDNFITYPLLQVSEGITLMKKAINDIQNNRVSPKKGGTESKLWYHPTIWRYLYVRLTRGVK